MGNEIVVSEQGGVEVHRQENFPIEQMVEFAKISKMLPKIDEREIIQEFLNLSDIKGVGNNIYYCWKAGANDIPPSPTVMMAEMIQRKLGLWVCVGAPKIEINEDGRKDFVFTVDVYDPRTFSRNFETHRYPADNFLGDWETATKKRNGQSISKAQIDTNRSRAHQMRWGQARSKGKRTSVVNFSGLRPFLKEICRIAREKEVKQIQKLSVGDHAVEIERIFGIFLGLGITKERVLINLGKTEKYISAMEIANLRGIYKCISDGQTTAEDAFPEVPIASDEPDLQPARVQSVIDHNNAAKAPAPAKPAATKPAATKTSPATTPSVEGFSGPFLDDSADVNIPGKSRRNQCRICGKTRYGKDIMKSTKEGKVCRWCDVPGPAEEKEPAFHVEAEIVQDDPKPAATEPTQPTSCGFCNDENPKPGVHPYYTDYPAEIAYVCDEHQSMVMCDGCERTAKYIHEKGQKIAAFEDGTWCSGCQHDRFNK